MTLCKVCDDLVLKGSLAGPSIANSFALSSSFAFTNALNYIPKANPQDLFPYLAPDNPETTHQSPTIKTVRCSNQNPLFGHTG